MSAPTYSVSSWEPRAPQGPITLSRVPSPKGGGTPTDSEGAAIVELWRFARRHPLTLGLAALAGLILALLFSLSQVPMYQASATLEIQDLNENFLNFKDVLPVSPGVPTTATNDMQTQLRILRSNTLIERALDRVGPERAPAAPKIQFLRSSSASKPKSREDRIGYAKDNLQVKEARQARIVDIICDSPDPQYAASLANAVAREYIEQNVESRWKMSQYTGEWLSRQLEEMRKKLATSEDNLQEYARRSGLLVTSDKSLSEERLHQIQTALVTAQQDRMARQSRLETALTSPVAASGDGASDASLKDIQTKLTDLRRQRADLATVFKPNFDGLKRLDAQIASLETAAKNERSAILQRLRNDYDDAMRRENLLQSSYARQTGLVSQETEKNIQYGMLKREVDSNRQLYELMLQRVKETSIASAMRASNVRVVDPAQPPSTPYKPSKTLNLIWGLTSGLLLGAVFAMVQERVDRRIQNPGDLGACLNVPELGTVPSLNGPRSLKARYLRTVSPSPVVDLLPDGTPRVAVKPGCLGLVAWQHRSSPFAESFRGILASILFSSQREETPRMIVVTSATASEGKTTVASNMAVSLARIDRKVLLIDADLHRPRLHEIFHGSNEYGLSDLLTLKGKSHREILHYVVQSTSVPGVFLLAAGPQLASATDLLYSAIMADVLRQAREYFDLILIDTPPLNDLQDARVLGRMSDGVVLVVRAGATTRDIAVSAAQRLIEDGTTVLGTVLNHWTNS